MLCRGFVLFFANHRNLEVTWSLVAMENLKKNWENVSPDCNWKQRNINNKLENKWRIYKTKTRKRHWNFSGGSSKPMPCCTALLTTESVVREAVMWHRIKVHNPPETGIDECRKMVVRRRAAVLQSQSKFLSESFAGPRSVLSKS